MDLGSLQKNVSSTERGCTSVPLSVVVGQTFPDASIMVPGELPSINIRDNELRVIDTQPPTVSGEISILECDNNWATGLFNPGPLPAESAQAQHSSANARMCLAVQSQLPVQCTSPNLSLNRVPDTLNLQVQQPAQSCIETMFTPPSADQGSSQHVQSLVLASDDPACASNSQNHVGLFQGENRRHPRLLQQRNFSQLGDWMEPFPKCFHSKQPKSAVPNSREMAEQGFTYLGEGIFQCQNCSVKLSAKQSQGTSDILRSHLCQRQYHIQRCENYYHGPQEQAQSSLNCLKMPPKTPELAAMLCATDEYGHKYFLHGPVKHPNYAEYRERFNSFLMMPSSVPKTPKELASAGFYFLRQPDQVACFCCGLGFGKWEPHDNPCKEHAFKSPNCTYVKQVLGSQSLQQQPINRSSTPIQTMTLAMNSSMDNWQELPIYSISHDLSNMSLDAIPSMSKEINYKAIADMGYQPDQIRRAITKLRGNKHIGAIDTNSIVNEILEMDEKKECITVTPQCFQCHQKMRDGYTLLPCGHVAICLNCDVKNILVCPVCDKEVTRCVVTYPAIVH